MIKNIDINTIPFLPEVSVIMPCYNAESYIAEAIESILHQSFSDFELILVNDGSTDKTLDVINYYASADNRIIVIDKENSGQTDTMNLGINKSRGRFIARLDNDDVALPDRLKEQVAFMKKNANVVLLGTNAFQIDAYGKIIKADSYPNNQSLLKNLIKIKKFFPHSSAMLRSDVLKSIGGYNLRYKIAQDHDLWFRLSEKGEIACINKYLVKIRYHSNNFSSNDNSIKIMIHEGIAANMCHHLRAKGLADPSISLDIMNWQLFLDWICQCTEQAGFLKRIQLWSQMRNNFFSSKNKLYGLLSVMKLLVASRCAYQIIYEKFCGTNLPVTLTNEWLVMKKFV